MRGDGTCSLVRRVMAEVSMTFSCTGSISPHLECRAAIRHDFDTTVDIFGAMEEMGCSAAGKMPALHY
jgi:hypothetical protein